MSSDRARWMALALALAAGCSYDWDSLRPGADAGNGDDVDLNATPDAPVDEDTGSKEVDAGFDAGAEDVVVAQDDGATAARDVGFDVPTVVDAGTPDAGPRDTGVIDVGTPDVGAPDVGTPDVGTPDAGTPDAGTPCTGALCPCAPSTPAGWCTVGSACTGGACAAVATTGALVISEFMNDPSAVDDMAGEWFEVYNAAATPVDLRGLRVRGSGTEAFTVTGAGPLLVAGHGYAVLGINADTAVNGGVTMVFAYGSAMTLSNSSSTPDSITLLTSDGATIDAVTYTNAAGAGWPITSGHSKALRPAMLDAASNDLPASWCQSNTPFGRGDYGTPGAANVCP